MNCKIKFLTVLCLFATVSVLLTGCGEKEETENNNTPGNVNSQNETIESDISSMADEDYISSVTDKISSVISDIR